MPLPEGYLPREGDELLIRVKVRFSVDAGETSVLIDRVTSVELNEIHAIYCRKWNEGDRVKLRRDDSAIGTVIATHGKHIWVHWDSDPDQTVEDFDSHLANDLEPEPAIIAAPETQPIEPPPAPAVASDDDDLPF